MVTSDDSRPPAAAGARKLIDARLTTARWLGQDDLRTSRHFTLKQNPPAGRGDG